jgi:hypothetical protein
MKFKKNFKFILCLLIDTRKFILKLKNYSIELDLMK